MNIDLTVSLLLNWWDAGHRQLPWRDTGDPYAIWIAEVMLQQTQIKTVLPYYRRWMESFPDVASLAAAPLDQVLKAWEGLGYYSRARNLHKAAQILIEEYGGTVPADIEALRALPGIGRYTAGAIASIAFGIPAPIVDGNITRVLSRLVDVQDDVTQTPTRRRLWQLAEALVPQKRPGEFNQALMELGQLICQPIQPECHRCPVNGLCLSRARGTQMERPVRPPRKRIPHYDVTAAVIRREDGRVLITQRPLDGMLGGLWEFPGGKREPGETLEEALHREIQEELGIDIVVGSRLVTIKHAYTHFRITLYVFNARANQGTPKKIGVADYRWVTLAELDGFAFARTDRQIVKTLVGQAKQ